MGEAQERHAAALEAVRPEDLDAAGDDPVAPLQRPAGPTAEVERELNWMGWRRTGTDTVAVTDQR
jgi:hypothetical protein